MPGPHPVSTVVNRNTSITMISTQWAAMCQLASNQARLLFGQQTVWMIHQCSIMYLSHLVVWNMLDVGVQGLMAQAGRTRKTWCHLVQPAHYRMWLQLIERCPTQTSWLASWQIRRGVEYHKHHQFVLLFVLLCQCANMLSVVTAPLPLYRGICANCVCPHPPAEIVHVQLWC